MPLNKLREQANCLSVLCDKKFPNSAKKALIKEGADEFINSISEICLNLIAGNVPISGKTLRKLKPQKRNLYYLASPKNAIPKKRKFLLRKDKLDSCLGTILPPALDAISSSLLTEESIVEQPIEIPPSDDVTTTTTIVANCPAGKSKSGILKRNRKRRNNNISTPTSASTAKFSSQKKRGKGGVRGGGGGGGERQHFCYRPKSRTVHFCDDDDDDDGRLSNYATDDDDNNE